MIGIYLSSRKHANSVSLFIIFSAPQWVKAKPRFTLVLERALSACRFTSLGLYFLFFLRFVHICNFLRSEWCPVAVLRRAPVLTCLLSLADAHFHPEQVKNNKIQAEGNVSVYSHNEFTEAQT